MKYILGDQFLVCKICLKQVLVDNIQNHSENCFKSKMILKEIKESFEMIVLSSNQIKEVLEKSRFNFFFINL